MTEETIIKKQVKDYLNLCRVFWFPVLQGLGCYKGLPDIFIAYNSKVVACEIKGKKGFQSDNQLKFQENWEASGNRYILARSVEDVEKLLKDINKLMSDQPKKDFIEKKLEQFSEMFDNKAICSPTGLIEIKCFILTALSDQKEELIKEFTEGNRCLGCGEQKEQDLSDTCGECLENN